MLKRGSEAWLKLKINHITDTDIVKKLYEASQAGVKVDIVIRGNCSLVPGVAGLSENIHAVGIIDRYLEHSRIIIFCNGGKPKYYIGSADWMPRNLINRIEVMSPVYDEDIRKDLLRTIEYGLHDTTNGGLLMVGEQTKFSNQRRAKHHSARKRHCTMLIMLKLNIP